MEEDTRLAETAFLVVRELDGTFRASTDLSEILNVNRYATLLDIKQAAHEILDKITEDAIAEAVVARLAAIAKSESKKVATSIREALDSRSQN